MIRQLATTLLLLVPSLGVAGEAVNNPDLEKSYRAFVKAIYQQQIEQVIGFVHKDGIMAGDERIPKKVVEKDLKDPDSYLRQMLYQPDDGLSDDLCEASGVSPLSMSEFYKRFGEKYQIKIVALSNKNYFSIGGSASVKTADDVSCRYYLFANVFSKEKDGKYYLVSGFE